MNYNETIQIFSEVYIFTRCSKKYDEKRKWRIQRKKKNEKWNDKAVCKKNNIQKHNTWMWNFKE